jgi:hypothetical protein
MCGACFNGFEHADAQGNSACTPVLAVEETLVTWARTRGTNITGSTITSLPGTGWGEHHRKIKDEEGTKKKKDLQKIRKSCRVIDPFVHSVLQGAPVLSAAPRLSMATRPLA